jgi:nicotinate dehydrogenase large molybdopterin subunit
MSIAVGLSIKRQDAEDKVKGRAMFPDDIEFEDMVYAGVVRSSIPYGRITCIDCEEARHMPGVLKIIDYSMIPGEKCHGVIFKDQPVLAKDIVKRVGDPILIVVACSKSVLKSALKIVKINYENYKGIFTVKEALKKDAPILGDGSNVLFDIKIRRGNVDKGFDEADYIVENHYNTPPVEHAFLQPEACMAGYAGDILEIYVATQYAHYDRKEVSQALNISENSINIINTSIGGAFGAREDITLQIHAALAAYYTKKPVKIVFTREESTVVHCKRHGMDMYYKTGATKNGKLCAMEARILGDTGAYCSWGINVLRKSAVHATGPYVIPNVSIESKAVYTNNSFAGAMRGFGAVQVAFACESQMDMLAEKAGINPLEFRYMNCFEKGSITATGQMLKSSVGIKQCIEKIANIDTIELKGVQ